MAISGCFWTSCCPSVEWASGSRSYGAQSPEAHPLGTHRRLSTLPNRESFKDWRPTIERNLDRLSEQVTGQPNERNLDHWRQLVDCGDLPGMHRVLTGLDRDSIEMREVSPVSGLLPGEQRREVLKLAG